MFIPKKVKYRKQQRGSMKGKATRGKEVVFGDYGLKSLDLHWVTARQIEAARRAMVRFIKREGKVWIRIFPHQAVTATPNETRMGGGKGSVSHYVATVKPGTIMFEMSGITEAAARKAMSLASHKLPVHTKFVIKE
ncbi:50S ribosomal protein L16 [candidate division Kazan bacterium RIFCSPHIGHO2_01_FULL_49_10]|uniref:Large ribosomal subunit protein uL16 n=1 Tax=candidate division Kazan bacterium RIFCSPLOWO2_01_FULL_48_13 TaxID=1798539 RepID=A0A1F4PRI1_UNCK3|nr:MAG: 50S ribosomal protein L16 [candidate division Kazan bacterium RIFCSPHIGHO2_01_FULL_49_10]OGB85652.1 MAG: 50S ribosomal protein L16 [candidate division Kazan bacterium RIFCSPLOWO2_01_FULL_48_13]